MKEGCLLQIVLESWTWMSNCVCIDFLTGTMKERTNKTNGYTICEQMFRFWQWYWYMIVANMVYLAHFHSCFFLFSFFFDARTFITIFKSLNIDHIAAARTTCYRWCKNYIISVRFFFSATMLVFNEKKTESPLISVCL